MSNRSTRRKFLKTTGSAASLALFAGPILEVLGGSIEELLASPTPYVRPNVKNLTATSKAIVSYGNGIKAMKALPSSNPLNWDNFANIHGSPSGSGPLWNTCQHGQWWFLPWHRMYLWFLEQAIRKYAPDPNFALPFWDYTDPTQRSLPVMFRQPANASNPLYVSQRNSQINAGAQLQPSTVSITNAMNQLVFYSSGATNFGSQNVNAPSHLTSPHGALESTPHDAVHVAIGGWMGQVNMAARDPIFWLHHANIDRLWNHWLTLGGGRKDPNNTTWCKQQFTFPNTSGSQTTWPTSGVINAQAQLGYTYEGQGAVPAQTCTNVIFTPSKAVPLELVKKPEVVRLAATPTHVSVPLAQAKSKVLEVAKDPKRTAVLRVEGIDIDGPPGVIYEVYVGAPSNAKAVSSSPNFVGVLAPFGAEGHGDHAEHGTFTAAFPIDAAVERALTASGDTLDVQFVPRGLLDASGKELPFELTGHITFKSVRLTSE